MAISQFPVASAGTTAGSTFVDAPLADTFYREDVDLPAGVYIITCAASADVEMSFEGTPGLFTTVNGTVTANLTSASKGMAYKSTQPDIRILLTLTGVLAGSGTTPTGSVETISTSGNYTNQPGVVAACLIGGGGGGGGTAVYRGGGGGGSGYATLSPYSLDGSPVPVTLGAGGAYGSGGTTNFGNLSALGGVGGGAAGGAGGSGGGGCGYLYGAGGNGGFDGNSGNGGSGGGNAGAGGPGSGVSVSDFTTSVASGIYGGGKGGNGAAGNNNPHGGVGGGGGGGVAPNGRTGGPGRVFLLRWS